MRTALKSFSFLSIVLALILPTVTFADNSGTLLCTGLPSSSGPVFVSFDSSYTLYTLNVTTTSTGNVVTRHDLTSSDIAAICSAGYDAVARADSSVDGDGSYFPAVVEFYNASLGHYFITSSAQEVRDLDAGLHAGWARTGQQFRVFVQDPTPSSGLFPLWSVCRYYGLPAYGLDTHFFSAFANECQAVTTNWPNQWELETPDAFRVHLPDSNDGSCPSGTVPLYRLYNNRPDVNHRYTTSLLIRQQMIEQSWMPEGFGPLGVGMCVRSDG